MRYPLLVAAVVIACVGCSKPSAPPVDAAELKTEEDKTLYALGSALGRNLASFDLTEAELDKVKAGLADAALHKEPKIVANEYFPKIQELQRSRAQAAAQVEQKAGDEFLTKAAAEKGAQKTASGLVYSVVTEGTGPVAAGN